MSTRESKRGVSRREFIKLATAAGLLAGCSSVPQKDAVPTSAPSSTPTSAPTRTPPHTPTVAPVPTVVIRRPEIIQTYPDVPSKVVHARHAGVRDGDALVPEVIRQMLDASIAELTGLNDTIEAWGALFSPDERYFHRPKFERAIAELNALPPIRERTRLIVGDVLTADGRRDTAGYRMIGTGDAILMSFDPVAHDAVGLQVANRVLDAEGSSTGATTSQASAWLENGTKLGLGTHDLDQIEWVEVTL